MKIPSYFLVIFILCISCKERENQKQAFRYFRNYSATFNDMNHKHLKVAKILGITPVHSIEEIRQNRQKLLKVKSSNLFEIDKLTHSHPYLVPEAYRLLSRIGMNYRDSLISKNLPPHKLIVTSILRTHSSVGNLRTSNMNASNNSAHLYGTTFDIAYTRFKKRTTREAKNDQLKSVLAEVLRDLQKAGKCYIRYEYKQGCFHITVRENG